MKTIFQIGLIAWASFVITESHAALLFVTNEYEPYVVQNDGIAKGIIPDIVTAIYQPLGIDIEFQFVPWKRAESMIQKGAAFASFPYIETPQRVKKYDFSDPVIFFFPKFFYLKRRFPNKFTWNNIEDFKDYRIGGVLGYWYQEHFNAINLNVVYVANDTQTLHMLDRERIDFTIIDEIVGWRLIEKLFPNQAQQFSATTKPESEKAFRLMISRTYPNASALKKQFNKRLKKLRETGEYSRILKAYSVPKHYSTQRLAH